LHRHPALRIYALACIVYDASAILAAKIRIIFDTFYKMVHFYTSLIKHLVAVLTPPPGSSVEAIDPFTDKNRIF